MAGLPKGGPPPGGGLVLERPAPARKSGRGVSALAGPVALGVIFVMLGAWMAFAYFVSGPETPAVAETGPVQAPAPLASTLTGSLTGGGKNSEGQVVTAQAGVKAGQPAAGQPQQTTPDAGTIAAAARQAVVPDTRVGQTGLMPSAAAKERQAAAKPAAAPAKPPAAASTAAQARADAAPAARPVTISAASNTRAAQPTPPPSAGSPGQPTMAAAASSGGPSTPRLASAAAPKAA
ncbi:hypothetical protein LJB86_05250, partial [Deltaproteobacteria bacterium OttesenSCG-928-M10]|nr:hypothetical protein [Deltaproteobacteria bacterium OttesenSCG-928-M10]